MIAPLSDGTSAAPGLEVPALQQALERLDANLLTAPWEALSGGQSNRVWRLGGLVVKLYRTESATPLFPNDAEAEARALRLFAPQGLAPCLRAVGPGWLVYDHWPGDRFRAGDDPALAARVLGKLHGQNGVAGFRSLANGSAALRADALRVASGHGIPPEVPDLPPVPARPVHADAVAGNVILGPQGTGLIDWQCPGLGDPAEDLAAFLSPLMQSLYAGRPLSAEDRARFLHAYPDRSVVERYALLQPLYDWRLSAHCAHRAARGDADYRRVLGMVGSLSV